MNLSTPPIMKMSLRGRKAEAISVAGVGRYAASTYGLAVT